MYFAPSSGLLNVTLESYRHTTIVEDHKYLMLCKKNSLGLDSL